MALTATIDLDWNIHEGRWDDKQLAGGGCGLGFAAMALVGDLANHERVNIMYFARVGLQYGFLGL